MIDLLRVTECFKYIWVGLSVPTQNSDRRLTTCRYGLVRVMKESSVMCFPHLQQDIKVEGLWDFLAFLPSAASCSHLKEK